MSGPPDREYDEVVVEERGCAGGGDAARRVPISIDGAVLCS